MLIHNPEDKLYFKCPVCGHQYFERVEILRFRHNTRQKQYLPSRDREIYRCLNCKHDVEKDQIR